jgi:phosphate starvation-inducible PhoH-like protein
LTQIDLPGNVKSGLRQSMEILRDIDGIAHIYLTAEDVVRHRLVKEIIKAYDFDDEKRRQAKKLLESNGDKNINEETSDKPKEVKDNE